jgi:hypothetical protein
MSCRMQVIFISACGMQRGALVALVWVLPKAIQESRAYTNWTFVLRPALCFKWGILSLPYSLLFIFHKSLQLEGAVVDSWVRFLIIYVCLHVCMYVCMHVYIYIYICGVCHMNVADFKCLNSYSSFRWGGGYDGGVGILTSCGLGDPGIESWWGRDFSCVQTQPSVQWVEGLSRGNAGGARSWSGSSF